MEFDEVVRRRRMVRGYDPDRPVPPELIDKIVRHGLRAPSAGFSQGWSFLVLTEREDRDRYWASTADGDGRPGDWLARMRTAPLIIVACSNKSVYLDRYAQPDKGWQDRAEERWPAPYWDIDTGFATLLMHLTAVNEDLGSCFIGLPAARVGAFKEAFGVPAEFNPIGALTVGYRGSDKRSPSLRRGHRPVADVVHHGRWASAGEV
ncbi:nitroreductase family protein [Actinoplanes sp. NEAU-A12]|uniref:Nitroreductase family protein n=1 Tax=Actinoplanes sandaracinus TaxID=3045177 RepID=A0ABT6WLB1_9ACTN|nr:nitroreductase family protein [Actinoplanes sandaracinus]MDI6100523.1 nitroreductase family protein [Actinoplanes sandaracinus]